METLAFLLLVAMVTNSTRVVSVSMEILDYGCLVTAASSQTCHNIEWPKVEQEASYELNLKKKLRGL
jgi:hypothetical protein